IFRKVEKNKKELKPYKIKILALFISKRKRMLGSSSYTSCHIVFLKLHHFLFLLVIFSIA
ncbi:hypothetical protein ACVWAY_10775, partial [Enterococcus faecalis]